MQNHTEKDFQFVDRFHGYNKIGIKAYLNGKRSCIIQLLFSFDYFFILYHETVLLILFYINILRIVIEKYRIFRDNY